MAFYVGTSAVGSKNSGDGVSWSQTSIAGAIADDLILLVFFGSYAESGDGLFDGPGSGWIPECDIVNPFRAPNTGGYYGRLVVWSRLATSGNLGATSGSVDPSPSGYAGAFNEWGVYAAVFRKTVENVPILVGNKSTSASAGFAGAGDQPIVLPANTPGRDALACVITMQELAAVPDWTFVNLRPSGNNLAVGRLHMRGVTSAGTLWSFDNDSAFTHRAFVFNLADEILVTTRRGPRLGLYAVR